MTSDDYFASRLIGGPKTSIAFMAAVDADAHDRRLIVWVHESVSVFYADDAREVYAAFVAAGMAKGANPFGEKDAAE